MGPLVTALIYFGSFLALDIIAKLAVGRWMSRKELDPTLVRIDRLWFLASLNQRGAGGRQIRHSRPDPGRARRRVLRLRGEPPIEFRAAAVARWNRRLVVAFDIASRAG